MFRFAEPLFLLILAVVVPVMVLLFWVYRKRQRRMQALFADAALLRQLSPMVSTKRVRYKFSLVTLAIGLVLLALAQPQFGSKLMEKKSRGVEIIIATDVSNSMLAEDFKPNRLERTKNAISQLLTQLTDHRVGLIVFAGDAFVQLPVTSDYVAAQSFISSMSPSSVPVAGTSISSALDLASRSFSSTSDKSRVVIVVTDGESHDDDPIASAKAASEAGITVYTIGIGTSQGSPITINGEMLRDENDEIVVSKLDEQKLQQIAAQTGGLYVRASENQLGMQEILKRIDQMQKEEYKSLVFQEYNDQFYYILSLAVLILVIEFLMIERKNKLLSKITIFKKENAE